MTRQNMDGAKSARCLNTNQTADVAIAAEFQIVQIKFQNLCER